MNSILLNNHSSKKEVSKYIKEFNLKTTFTEEDIEELLQNLVALEIDTYTFSIGANIASRTISKSIIDVLEEYMAAFDKKVDKKDEDYDKAFAAYYLLTYYYRTYEKLEKYAYALNMYQSYFEAKASKYALAYQIKARYLRKHGDGKEAIAYDRRAVELLKEKNIENIHVRITLAATIAIALENRESFISEKDIEDSFETVQKAIMQNSDYAKYRYLWAKLKMFSLIYKNDHNQLIGIDYAKEILEAKKLLRDAVELEDAKADSYASSIIEYRSYMRAADLVLSELKLTERIKQMEASQNTLIHQYFVNNRNEADKNLRNTQSDLGQKLTDAQSDLTKRLVDTQNDLTQKLTSTQTSVTTRINKINTDLQKELSDAKTSFANDLKASQEHYLEILGVIVAIVAVIMVVIGTYSAKLSITAILVATFGMSVGMIGVYAAFLLLLKDEIKKKYVVFLVVSVVVEIIVIIISICWPTIRTFLAI